SRDHSHGRIWRVTYKGRPLVKPPKIAGESVPKLLDLLKLPEDRTRYRVRRELAARKTSDVLPALKTWVAGLDANDKDHEHHLLEALWVYQTHNAVNEPLLKRLLESHDHRARAAATRVLSWCPAFRRPAGIPTDAAHTTGGPNAGRRRVFHPLELLGKRVNDKHARVRLEAVRACSFIHSPKSLETALDVLNHGMDQYLTYTLDETIRVLQQRLVGVPDAHAHHNHDHGHSLGPRPLVFLNKSTKIVQFQLDRLAASQLLMVERSTRDAKFAPVYSAILTRPGVSRQDRAEAAAALATLNRSDVVHEVLMAAMKLDRRNRSERDIERQLAAVLLGQSTKILAGRFRSLNRAMRSENRSVRILGYAGTLAIGKAELAWSVAAHRHERQDLLASVAMIPSRTIRIAQRDRMVKCLDKDQPLAVRRSAIEAVASVPGDEAANFKLVAPFVSSRRLRAAAVRTLSHIPEQHRSPKAAANIVAALVKHAETTPAARRTTTPFLEAMDLTDKLLALLPAADARRYRTRLREVVVRVVQINTVHEEMRYDTPYFAAEAGRPVQLVLQNNDLMPHNLVITRPGKLKAVAFAAAKLPPTIDRFGRQYVPKSNDVLIATKLVPSHGRVALTFTAPRTPGEYPYVCTFPNHWMRMYGVMVVVKDLDAWTATPAPPADPLGYKRKFVQTWTLEDFDGDLAAALAKRQPKVGQQIFQQATCVLCHKIGKQGRPVGPDLTGVFERHKGDHRSVLREVLDPSHKVDPRFALYNVVTAGGKVISGIITKQDRESVTIVSNPENPKPQTIAREDIDVMKKSSVSMMPKGILDRFTRDEILELLAYLKSVAVVKKSPAS
ncbi:MAG: c-type cytochrome, partial [Planctomycetaceae bacterium]